VTPSTSPLYSRVLGPSWTSIAPPVQCAHNTESVVHAHGLLRVEYGQSAVARLLARVLRLPRPSAAADTRLVVTARAGGEEWERTFDGLRFVTRQDNADDFELAERFGVLEFRFRLDVTDGSLVYVQRRVSLRCGRFRLRIPAAWAPRVEAREDPAGPARVNIHVRVVLPGVGLLMTYGGVVHVEETPA
jgi:uncharacterized protein DUF4166